MFPKKWNKIDWWLEGRRSRNGIGVKGAGDGEAIEPLHGGDSRGDRVGGAEGVGPHVPWWQVAVLLQPWLWKKTKKKKSDDCASLQHYTGVVVVLVGGLSLEDGLKRSSQ